MSTLDALPPARGPGDVPVTVGARCSVSGAIATENWWRRRQRRWSPILLLAPACLLFATFVIYPILASLRLSLFDWGGIGARTWIGLGNYRELLTDPVFHTALANNVWWLLLFMLAPVGGFALALLLNQQIRGMRLVRSLFFFPFVISHVVVGLVFAWFFNAQFGLLNEILGWLGLARVALLEDETFATFAVIAAGLWPQIAYCMIIYLAGLATLDPQLVEAGRLDGASGWRLLWHVVLPQLRAATYIAVIVSVVGALRSFDLVMTMTLGGPYDSSTVLAYYMYEQTFLAFRYGYGAAIATVLFLVMNLCIALVLWRMLRGERA
jgi:multiple sugar transport system permease protein